MEQIKKELTNRWNQRRALLAITLARLTGLKAVRGRLRGFLRQEEAEGFAVRTGAAFLQGAHPDGFGKLGRAAVQGVGSREQGGASGRGLADRLRALVPRSDQLLKGIEQRGRMIHGMGRMRCTEGNPKVNVRGDRAAVHCLASRGGR